MRDTDTPSTNLAEATSKIADPRRRELQRVLEKQLVARATADGVVYVLDLRQKRFAALPSTRVTLRRPGDAGWPNRGATTDNEDQAKRWIVDRYVTWIADQLDIGKTTPGAVSMTLREGAQRYVDSLKVVQKRRDGTVEEIIPEHKKSRVSMLRRNVLPALGHLPMVLLDAETVGPVIEHLHILRTVERGKKKVKVPAEYGTRRNFKAALSAVWRFIHKYRTAPFAAVRIETPAVLSSESQEVDDFESEDWLDDDRTGALDVEQLTRALVAAMYRDRELMRRPNTRGRMIPNTAHAIALQATTGVRISEELKIRWGHIYEAGYIVVHNSKRQQVRVKCRIVPSQHALEPWLEELRQMEGGNIDPNGFVIRTDPMGGQRKPGVQNTISSRIAKALELAGLKIPQKATHPMRATFASQAEASEGISAKVLSRYLGHHRVYGTSTDKYIRQLVKMMKPQHRDIIQLPTPAEVRALLDTFEPAEVLSWKERHKPQIRTNAAKKARRDNPRGRLGASLDLPDDS